jgi:phosphotransferase system HPr (HPr) family protein
MNAMLSAPSAIERPKEMAGQKLCRSFRVNLEHGLHARPCAMLVKTLQPLHVSVVVASQGEQASGKSILGLMSLAAAFGDDLAFTITGPDAFQAMTKVAQLFETRFGTTGGSGDSGQKYNP